MSSETADAPPPPITLKIRFADAAALLLAAIAVWIEIVGGRRYLVFGTVVSLKSPLFPAYAAASVFLVRHLLWPRPSALQHLRATARSLAGHPDFAVAVRAFLATRPAVLIVGLFAVVTFGFAGRPGFSLSDDPLANLPARYDAGWYGGIAIDGYSWDHSFQRQRNIAFFPAYPMLMRPVGAVFGMDDRLVAHDRRMLRGLWAGVVISLAAFLWALWYLVRLGRDLVGPEAAVSAAFLLGAYPFALFFSAPYTESLYLLSALGAFYHFRRTEWVAASMWGLLLGLTRPNGCFASVPLAIVAWQQLGGARAFAAPYRWQPVAVRLLVAAMPGIGMLLFTAYLYHLTGVWFAWARSHEAWGRTYQGFAQFQTAFEWIRDDSLLTIISNVPYNSLNTIAVLFGLLLTYPVFRRLGAAWGVFVLINLVPPLFAGGVLSMGRLTATLFPLFFALAVVIPPGTAPAWIAGFGIAQGLCAALFFTWRQLF
jgi:Gpi18-like mannosyltransferase